MTVGELEQRMSARERRHWAELEARSLVPLPDHLFDTHLAMIAALMVNIMGATASPVSARDFFVIREPELPNAPTDIDAMRRQWRGE
jgi:hypothetical protein